MNTNYSISISSKRKIVALGIILTIGVFLNKKRPDESPKTAKEEPPLAQPEAKDKSALIGSGDAVEHFRQIHNHALSPEAREDVRRERWKPIYDPAVTATAELIYGEPESLIAAEHHYLLKIFFESELRFSQQF